MKPEAGKVVGQESLLTGLQTHQTDTGERRAPYSQQTPGISSLPPASTRPGFAPPSISNPESKHLCGKRSCQSHYSHSCPRATKLLCPHKAVSAPGRTRPVPETDGAPGPASAEAASHWTPLEGWRTDTTALMRSKSQSQLSGIPASPRGVREGRAQKQGTRSDMDLPRLIFFDSSGGGGVTSEDRGKNLTKHYTDPR